MSFEKSTNVKRKNRIHIEIKTQIDATKLTERKQENKKKKKRLRHFSVATVNENEFRVFMCLRKVKKKSRVNRAMKH